MVDWPNSLVGDLARRRVVIVIGSGVSRHSRSRSGIRPPVWGEFLRKAVDECPKQDSLSAIREAVDSGDYLHACEWLKDKYDEQWIPYLRKIFRTPAFEPAEVHKQVLSLDSRIVFTLNFDNIYEAYANSVQTGAYITKNYSDHDVSEFLRGEAGNRYIVRVHGDLNAPSKMIFTHHDYAKARIESAQFYQAFDAALLTHTFLFIGSGYTDPDINLILENQNFSFSSASPHYFLTASGINEERKSSMRKNRNLKVLEYDRIDDDHSGLISVLKILNDLVETEKYNLSGSTSW